VVTRRRIAALVIAVVGAIHLALAPEQLDSKTYVGILFILAGIGSAFVAARLWTVGGQFAWILGAAICVGTFAGFVLSRTVGLPGFKETDWEVWGIASLAVEGLFLVLFAYRERRLLVRATRTMATSR
jgi:hypothetical protein